MLTIPSDQIGGNTIDKGTEQYDKIYFHFFLNIMTKALRSLLDDLNLPESSLYIRTTLMRHSNSTSPKSAKLWSALCADSGLPSCIAFADEGESEGLYSTVSCWLCRFNGDQIVCEYQNQYSKF